MRRGTHTTAKRGKANRFRRLPLTSAIYLALGSTAAFGQAAGDAAALDAGQAVAAAAQAQSENVAADETNQPTLETITVTAQKRAEDVQKVPINITVFSTVELEEQNIKDFDDYAKLLPSLSYQSFGPGFAQVYMRGIASGGDGNHSASLPSVGIYLDEQPVTTIQGALDVHIYDIERVEALAGPQGTLYGASSQSGTIRIITNKPDPSGFSAAYGLEANAVDDGGVGWVGEGYVNVPLTEKMALRVVMWDKRDAGYIDNVFGLRTFPTSGITIDNTERTEDNYNEVYTRGARAALKFDINDDWTVTPTVMHQRQKSGGSFAYDPNVGDLQLTHFYPERAEDQWTQAALTMQGKIGNLELTYAYSHLKRDVDTESDYTDYAFWYDTLYGYGAYFYNNAGELINPSQYIQGHDNYTKDTHEVRLASPKDQRFRFVVGGYWQDQHHDIEQRYKVDDLADALEVTGWPDTIWLTQQDRDDKDTAVFGEMSYDITDKLTLTGGARYFWVDNSLKGFFGFGTGYSGSTGEAACFPGSGTFDGAPCVNLDKEVEENDWLGRVNLTYQIDEDKMIYGTWSEGYRPGGINRRGSLPPYVSDFLTNWEFGWKTLWLDNRLSFNGAVFREEWDDLQFPILGQNGLTEIKNANQARVDGLELAVNWAATYNLTLSAGAAFFDSELTENYCGFTDEEGNPVTDCDEPEAPEGTQLPVTADFKGNFTARYEFNVGSFDAYWQATVVYEGDRTSDLRVFERSILGDLPSYWLADFSVGFKRDSWAIDFYLKNAFDDRSEYFRFAQCAEAVCGEQTYILPSQPRTIGVKFSQRF